MVRDNNSHVSPNCLHFVDRFTMHLVPIITIEEVELALLSMRVTWQAEELARLQRQLEPLESAFSAFEHRVARQANGVTAERNRLRTVCAEMENYTARIHARLVADPDGHLGAVFSPDELRRIGTLCGVEVPDDWFGEELHATTCGDGWYSTDESWQEMPISQDNSPTDDDAAELRSLYRQLARTFHPDLTNDDRERDFRQEVMLRINHAWHVRDLPGMRAIRNDVHDLLSGQMMSAVAYRLAWHKRELARLQEECQQCIKRIAALRSSKTMTLWHNPALANAAISRHISRIEREILELEQRRIAALDEFRQALGAYTSSRQA